MRKHSRRNNVNPSHFEVIPTFPEDGKNKYSVHAIIETPRNLRHKYALEPEYGIFKLKTIIAEGLAWPYDYGFIPRTLGDDGRRATGCDPRNQQTGSKVGAGAGQSARSLSLRRHPHARTKLSLELLAERSEQQHGTR